MGQSKVDIDSDVWPSEYSDVWPSEYSDVFRCMVSEFKQNEKGSIQRKKQPIYCEADQINKYIKIMKKKIMRAVSQCYKRDLKIR